MRSSSREIYGGTDRGDVMAEPPKPSSFIAWWTRHFRGDKDQVVAVRHWLEDLLPECPARADLLLLTSELCTNAIVHSRSGEAGGQFSVDIDWAPELARVVVGDQGSAKSPAIAVRSGDAVPLGESGRGLLLVSDIADRWGTASRPSRRWVWADVAWQARGGPPLAAPGGLGAAIASNTEIRKSFPGTSIWWGHRTRTWWAAVPGPTDAHDLICAPTRDSLIQSLVRAYPRAATGGLPNRPALLERDVAVSMVAGRRRLGRLDGGGVAEGEDDGEGAEGFAEPGAGLVGGVGVVDVGPAHPGVLGGEAGGGVGEFEGGDVVAAQERAPAVGGVGAGEVADGQGAVGGEVGAVDGGGEGDQVGGGLGEGVGPGAVGGSVGSGGADFLAVDG
jgi:serine/threonine-protein kinase RsbW